MLICCKKNFKFTSLLPLFEQKHSPTSNSDYSKKNKSNAENASSGIVSAWRKYCSRNNHLKHHKTAFGLCSCMLYLLRNGWCWLPEESPSYESLCLRLSGVFLLRVSLGADRSMLLLLRRLLELRLGLTSGLS